MPSLFTILYTLYARIVLTIAIIIFSIPLMLCLMLPEKFLVENRLFIVLQRIFYWICIRCSLLPIRYRGISHIPHGPAIIIANHQSSLDIPLVGSALGSKPHVWLAWSEVAKGPLMRFILPRVAILVNTSSPMRAMRTLSQAIATVKEKPWDLIIFPEGGRFTDGKTHEFFAGFAALAAKTGRPVVPLYINGVNRIFPPKTFWIMPAPITVTIGTPFYIQAGESEQAFKNRVYAWFCQEDA